MDFYKHDIPDWMDGTEGLDDGPYRAYHVICQLIYQAEGPIRLNEHGIAGRCKQSIRSFRANLKSLIGDGKLTISDGKISNSRAKKEIEKVSENRLNASKGGHRSAEVRSLATKSLELNGSTQAPLQNNLSLIEKRRGEETKKEKDGACAPVLDFDQSQPKPKSAEEQAKSEFYAEVGRLFNGKGGGVATNLLKAKGGNVWQAMAALGSAKESGDPRSYIGGIIRKTKDYSPII